MPTNAQSAVFYTGCLPKAAPLQKAHHAPVRSASQTFPAAAPASVPQIAHREQVESAAAPSAAPPKGAAAGGDAVPEIFVEGIFTQEVMEDPVVAADGFMYEKRSILEWFRDKRTSPTTGAVLSSASLIPNHSMKSQINRWREHRGQHGARATHPSSDVLPPSHAPQSQAPHAPAFSPSVSFGASHGGHATGAAAWIEEVDSVKQQHHARNSAAVILVDGRQGGNAAFMVQEKNGCWGFVAGKIDPGETAFNALLR